MRKNDKKKIAILGGTGHIGKALLYWLSKKDDFYLYLFSRSFEKAEKELKKIFLEKRAETKSYKDFYDGDYDAIINCIGIGDPSRLKNAKFELFYLTEYYDNLIINYVKKNLECLYINISSGAAYGKNFLIPANEHSSLSININQIEEEDYYGISKLYSEIKHRSLAEKNIVDLRVFGFFSRFIDLETKYLMTDVIRSLIHKEVLKTNQENIIRDYINPKDLANLIEICIEKRKLNDAFDVYSKKPISKFEILEIFEKLFGLKYEVDNNFYFRQATGLKINYYTKNYKAGNIGYRPLYSSLETLIEEAQFILEKIRT